MTTDIFCFYLQNRKIQTSQVGGQRYSDTSLPLVFPASTHETFNKIKMFNEFFYQLIFVKLV
jgi:hypothetical protein